MGNKQFTAELTDEAEEQLFALSVDNRVKIAEAIRTFENVGTQYKNINDLGNGLFEIKPKKVRAYFTPAGSSPRGSRYPGRCGA